LRKPASTAQSSRSKVQMPDASSDALGTPEPSSAPFWAPVAVAWSFLTIVPAPTWSPSPGVLATSAAFFPLVGLALGALLGILGLMLDQILPAGPVAVLILATEALLTGGLHLDGLQDTADGVFGGRTRDQRLEIMKDSRIGAFGTIAAVVALLGAFVCLADLTGQARLLALIASLTFSRWTMAIALAVFPSARSTGLGASFRQCGRRWPAVVASIVVAALAILVRPFGLIGLAIAALVVLFGGQFLTKRLGGLTGDCYGALAVVVEVAVLYLAVGML